MEHDSLADVWRRVRATESTPPLFYYATWLATRIAGSQGEAALRLVAATASVLCVPAAFVAVRRFVGERAALGAAFLFAASPLMAWYALDARAYSLLVLLSLLSLWATALLLEAPSRRRWGLWAALGATALWTHYYAGFLLLAEFVLLLARRPGARRELVVAALAIAALAAPLVRLFSAQRGESLRADYIADTPLTERLEQLVREFATGPNVPAAWLEAAGLVLALGGAGAGLALLWGQRRRDAVALAAIAGVAAGVPIALDATGVDDHFLMRNVLIAWAPLVALAAVGLVRLRAAGLIAYVALGASIVLATQADWRYQLTDWRGAVAEIEPAARERPVVVLPALQTVVAGRYLRRGLASGPVTAREAWVLVEPARQGRRELTPVRGAPPPGFPPGFSLVRAAEHRGFRLLLYRAARPRPLDAARLGADPATGAGGAATLVP